jgi:prolyl-tRNA synthetase
LETIQAAMFEKAKAGRDEKIVEVTEWKDFVPALERQCMVLTPFCDQAEWEEKVKKMSRDAVLNGAFEAETTATSVAAKTLCKPFKQLPLPEGTKCFVSGLPATTWVLWGRSY